MLGGYRFHFSKADFNLMVGYKGVDLSRSGTKAGFDLVLHGPVMKLGFEF